MRHIVQKSWLIAGITSILLAFSALAGAESRTDGEFFTPGAATFVDILPLNSAAIGTPASSSGPSVLAAGCEACFGCEHGGVRQHPKHPWICTCCEIEYVMAESLCSHGTARESS